MDKLDTEILNEIQWTFPLVSKPFDEMAKKFGISSDEVKTRLVQLKRKGVL
ncbi:MAG TPA: Lrp/AsnC family transcriptional regulator, partial [Candidatus Nitrosopelagicus sp.]|nr:Lrp/AsnC family transcriptional regulator [Candidatus Nitrosopelagicus sp.]